MNKTRKLQIQGFIKIEADKVGKNFTEFTKSFLLEHLKDWKGAMKDDHLWTNEDQIVYEMIVHVIEILEE